MRVFIAMPFVESFEPYWQVIQEVCKNKDLEVFRIDKNLSFERHIDIAIRREIRSSDFVIALLTGDRTAGIPNPNVSFEVGYAQGLGLETILFVDKVEHLPFDFKQQRTCLYDGEINKFREGLQKEISLLKKMMQEEAQESVQKSFKEIARCLRITLPAEYSLFKENKGFVDNKLWFSIYFSDPAVMRYVAYMSSPEKVSLACWIHNREVRVEQREFYKAHYNHLQRQLGHDVFINLHTKEHPDQGMSTTLEMRRGELLKEEIITNKKVLDTNEALKIALRLTDYVLAFEHLNQEFFEKVKDKITAKDAPPQQTPESKDSKEDELN